MLVTPNGRIKITDFGTSRFLEVADQASTMSLEVSRAVVMSAPSQTETLTEPNCTKYCEVASGLVVQSGSTVAVSVELT